MDPQYLDIIYINRWYVFYFILYGFNFWTLGFDSSV